MSKYGKLRTNNNRKTSTSYRRKFYTNNILAHNYIGNIVVTRHATERFKLRTNVQGDNNERIKQIITTQVRNSALVSMYCDAEHRSYKGTIFVCKRDEFNNLTVITVKLSKEAQLENFKQNPLSKLDYQGIDMKKQMA